jgi:hypothetical protein
MRKSAFINYSRCDLVKKCPKCQRSYGEDLNFCLDDGTVLVDAAANTSFPEAETLVNTQPPITIPNNPPRPTVYAIPNQPFQTAQRGLNPLIYAVLGIGLLMVGLVVGGGIVLFVNPKPNNDNNSGQVTTNRTTNSSNIINSSSNGWKDKSEDKNTNTVPTPEKSATPKPSPTVANIEPSPTAKPIGCYLHDGGKGEGEVRVRQNCDYLDCENDDSTVVGIFPNRTPVQKLGGSVQSDNFTWTKVKLKGRTVWVATSKIRCD